MTRTFWSRIGRKTAPHRWDERHAQTGSVSAVDLSLANVTRRFATLDVFKACLKSGALLECPFSARSAR